MTETSEILKAKIEATKSMAEAFLAADLVSIAEARKFIETWAAAVGALASVEPAKDDDSEPPIGATVIDRDGDLWTRTPDKLWCHNYSPDEYRTGEGWDWDRLQARYGPTKLRNL